MDRERDEPTLVHLVKVARQPNIPEASVRGEKHESGGGLRRGRERVEEDEESEGGFGRRDARRGERKIEQHGERVMRQKIAGEVKRDDGEI